MRISMEFVMSLKCLAAQNRLRAILMPTRRMTMGAAWWKMFVEYAAGKGPHVPVALNPTLAITILLPSSTMVRVGLMARI